VLASTVRLVGDLDVAEECVQDAFLSALRVWGERGIPTTRGLAEHDRPPAGDRPDPAGADPAQQAPAARGARPGARRPAGTEEDAVIPDDRLRLVFTCAHPALSPQAREALTLRLVCGLSTAEVGRAFL
jgi:RNA polymerase sigma-70 factor (ECF subfamily)